MAYFAPLNFMIKDFCLDKPKFGTSLCFAEHKILAKLNNCKLGLFAATREDKQFDYQDTEQK
jgi:hypothetical protein